jgi:hypothetical protein
MSSTNPSSSSPFQFTGLPIRSARPDASTDGSVTSDGSTSVPPILTPRSTPSPSAPQSNIGNQSAISISTRSGSQLTPGPPTFQFSSGSQLPPRGPVFRFGSSSPDHPSPNLSSDFTFRSLHNASPQPPRRFPERAETPSSTPSSTPSRSSSAPQVQTGNEIHTRPVSSAGDIQQNRNETFVSQTGSPLRPTPLVSSSQVHYRIPSLSEPPAESDERPGQNRRTISDASITSTDSVTEPYDVRDETAPQEPVYTHAFQSALREGIAIANEAATSVNTLASRSNLQQLLEQAELLRTFRSSDTRTVAVLGDSGDGILPLLRNDDYYSYIAC